MTATAGTRAGAPEQPAPEQPTPDATGTSGVSLAILRLAILLVCGATLGLSIVSHSILPARFFNDENLLLTFASSSANLVGEGSYRATARVLSDIGFVAHPTLQVVITIVVFSLLTAPRVWPTRTWTPSPVALLFFLASMVLAFMYLTQITKELLVLPVAVAAVFAPKKLPGDVLVVGAMVLVAVLIRPYWALVIAGYLVVRLARSLRMRSLFGLAAGLLVWQLVLSVAIFVATGGYLAAYRAQVALQLSSTRGSQIFDYIATTDTLSSWLDALLSLLLVVVAVPLFLNGSITFLFFGLFMLGAAVLYARGWTMQRGALTVRSERALALFAGLVTVQSTFEPDYGSLLRHLAPMTPLLVALAVDVTRAKPPRSAARAVPVA